MSTLLVVPGSWRKGSYNMALARAAVACAPAGCSSALGSIRDVPLYDGDVEAAGVPAAVLALKEAVATADGVLLVTPEYNNSIPGTFKNAIDWLSRPPKDAPRIFRDRPFGLIGATPGMGGTRLSQAAWLPVLRTLGVQLWNATPLYVAGAAKVFDADGALIDEKVRELLTRYMQGLAQFVARLTAFPRAG
jgi:NAD(P)H-dependent FMN reductase